MGNLFLFGKHLGPNLQYFCLFFNNSNYFLFGNISYCFRLRWQFLGFIQIFHVFHFLLKFASCLHPKLLAYCNLTNSGFKRGQNVGVFQEFFFLILNQVNWMSIIRLWAFPIYGLKRIFPSVHDDLKS